MLKTHFCYSAGPLYWPNFLRAACASVHGSVAPFHCKGLVLAVSKMSKLGRETNTKHWRVRGWQQGISLCYLAWWIWDVQDYTGKDCSPLIIIPVKYCWTYRQAIPREYHQHWTTKHVLLLLKALHEACSLKADITLAPSCHPPLTNYGSPARSQITNLQRPQTKSYTTGRSHTWTSHVAPED